MKLVELVQVDDVEIDIAQHTVAFVEEMDENTNPNFPEARSFVQYIQGQEPINAVAKTPYTDLTFALDVNVTYLQWVELTRQDTGLRILFRVNDIVGRKSLPDGGCEVLVSLPQIGPTEFKVRESRSMVKLLMEGTPNVVPQLVPADQIN